MAATDVSNAAPDIDHDRWDRPLLTVQEAARFLNVTVSWVYEHVRDDAPERLPVLKLGKYLRFDQKDLRAYVDAKRGAARPGRRKR